MKRSSFCCYTVTLLLVCQSCHSGAMGLRLVIVPVELRINA
jgi:hypothetical protein